MKIYITTECGAEVYIEPDPRGDSETYLPYQFVAYSDGRVAWHAGVKRDTGALIPEFKSKVEEFLKGV